MIYNNNNNKNNSNKMWNININEEFNVKTII